MGSITDTLRATVVLIIIVYACSYSGLPDQEIQRDPNIDAKLLSNKSYSSLEIFDDDQDIVDEIGIYSLNSSYALNDSFEDDLTTEDFLEFMYPKSWTWALIFFHCIVFVVGLVGNCLVCVAVYRNHTMRTVTNYFIVNLAAADFLVILFCLPPSVVWDVTSTWWFGIAMCKVVLYLQVSCFHMRFLRGALLSSTKILTVQFYDYIIKLKKN